MGTNYYLFTKNRDLVHKHFAVEHDWGVTDQEYEIVEYPQLGYQIHVCKLSWGWLPLFQRHKAFKTWAEFEEFYRSHSNHLSLIDEYDHFMTFDDFKTRVFEHAARKPEPVKWVYDYHPIDVQLGRNGSSLHLFTTMRITTTYLTILNIGTTQMLQLTGRRASSHEYTSQ